MRWLIPVLLPITGLALAGCARGPALDLDALFFGGLRDETPAAATAMNHYLVAILHESGGRFEQAAEALEEAAALDPGNPTLHTQRMQLYFRMQAFDEAAEAGETAVALRPDDPGLWIVLGGVRLQQNDYEGAADAFREVIRLDPDSPVGYEALIMAEESTNDLVATLRIYDKLIELNPNSATLHFQRGLNLSRISDSEAARASLERALELNEDLLRARYLLGITCLELGDAGAAQHHLSELLDRAPDYQGAREHLAAAHVRLGELPRAMRILNVLFARGEAEPRHYIQAMFLNLYAGRYTAAEGVPPPPDAPILGQLLQTISRKGQEAPYADLAAGLDEVQGDLGEEARRFINDLFYLYGREEAGTFLAGALAELREEGISSRVIDTLYGRVLMTMNEDEAAEAVFLDALENHGPDRDVHHYLANIYHDRGDTRRTERHLRNALKQDPDNPTLLNFLGYFYAEEDMRLEEAREMLRRALELDPDNVYYLDSLGWIYYRMGDADRAIELIRRAIFHMNNDDAILRNHLGDAYLLRGDVEKAIAEWERARRLDPELEGVQEKIDKHRGKVD